MKGNSNFFWLGLFIFFFLPGVCLAASSTGSGSSPHNTSGKPVQFLTGPNSGNPLGIALAYLEKNKKDLGISSTDIAGAKVTDQYTSSHNGTTHIYLRQRYHGFEVHSANININIAQDGSVINLGNRFISNIEKAVNTTAPSVSVGQAVSSAASSLGLVISKPLERMDAGTDPFHQTLNDGGISINPIPVKLVYQPVSKNQVRLAWDLEIYELDAKNWWSMRVDAATGAVLDQVNYVQNDSYNAYPLPVESPSHGIRSIIPNPSDATASPSGWIGAGLTCTQGNNVDAYLDTNNSNGPTLGDGDRACNAGLDFDFTINLTLAPSTYQDAAITNLFYWNNIIHDVFYQYGFNEASGNFQEDNLDNGGSGSDSVYAEAQDGGGTNNANFATPPDGSNPRMQMYIWTSPNPDRDGDLDNGIIIHEYGHGISNRLTGGPAASLCLQNTEQMGEGWSDFFAVLMTIETGDFGTDRRGVGTYALGQPVDGNGIRTHPYSTSMNIDPRTYDDIKTAAVPHGVGSIWAAMLWEMTWALIDRDGFDPDLYNGTGGNNTALQLVVDGLKIQGCSPGFIDGRDAILLADQNNNAGANQCLIWEAFAKRGLGYGASQGSSSSRTDGVEAFDIPPACEGVTVSKSADLASVESLGTLEYTLYIKNNNTDPRTNVIVTDTVPDLTSYVSGSATCGGSVSPGGIVTFNLGLMSGGDDAICSFKVEVDVATANVLFEDDMESGGGLWTASHASSAVHTDADWILNTDNSHSPDYAWFAQDVATRTDQYLAMNSPVSISGAALLRFWHDYDTEVNWDGGVVEISVDGITWSDSGSAMIKNGYPSTLFENPDRDIGTVPAFNGDSGGYVETWVDLSGYAGSNVQIRFRMATDGLVGGLGWYVDDVKIHDNSVISNEACVTSDEGDYHCDSVRTAITPSTTGGTPDISVSPENLSASQETNQTSFQSLGIGNIGSANLVWNIETDSSGDCISPDNNVSWVGIPPDGDTTAPGESTSVSVEFDSADLAPAVYMGALCIISNDPDTPVEKVDLTLTVIPTPIQMHFGDLDPSSNDAGRGKWNGHVDCKVLDQNGNDLEGAIIIGNWSNGANGTGSCETGIDGWCRVTKNSIKNNTSSVIFTVTGITKDGYGYNSAENSDPEDDSDGTNAEVFKPGSEPPPDPPSGVFHIGDLDGTTTPGNGNKWNATVTVNVHNAGEAVVDGITVNGSWSEGANGSGSCTTLAGGTCQITKNNIRGNIDSVKFTVGNLNGANYDQLTNHDPDGDSNGTAITIAP